MTVCQQKIISADSIISRAGLDLNIGQCLKLLTMKGYIAIQADTDVDIQKHVDGHQNNITSK